MISELKKQLQSPMYKPFLWLIALSFILGAYTIPAVVKSLLTPVESWSLRINGWDVSTKELAHEVHQKEELIAQIRSRYGAYTDYLLHYMGMSGDPRTLAVESIIREMVLYQAGLKLSIKVHDDYVLEMLRDKNFVSQELVSVVPAYLLDEKGLLSQKKLTSYLSAKKLSMEKFDQKIERFLTQRMVTDIVSNASYVPQAELAEELIIGDAARQFTVLKLSFDTLLKKEKSRAISAEELEKFFEAENKSSKRYLVPEKRGGKVWQFNADSYHIAVSNQDIESHYEENRERSFVESPIQVQVRLILLKGTTPAERRLAADKIEIIKNKLAIEPDQFKKIAQAESQDEATASNGGLMPFFSKGQQEPLLERTAFQLKNDGDISEVIELSTGYALLQRVAKKPKSYMTLENARDTIVKKLKQEKFKKMFAQDMKAVLDSNESVEQALMDLARQKNVLPEDVELQERNDSKIGASLFKLKKDGLTFYFEKEDGFVIKLTQIQEQFLPSLESIEPVVMDDLWTDLAKKSLSVNVAQMRSDAKTESFEQVADKYRALIATTEMIKPSDNKLVTKLEKEGLPIKRMLQLSTVGTVLTQEGEDFGYLVRLDAIDKVLPEGTKEKGNEHYQKIAQGQRQKLFEGFVASLYRNATIEINDYSAATNEDYLS